VPEVGLRLVHMFPGRMRLKLDQVKGDVQRAREIEEGLRRVPRIHSADANPLTGSLLITYDPQGLDSMEMPFAVANVLGISLNDLDPEQLRLLMSCHDNGSAQVPISLPGEIETVVGEMNAAVKKAVGTDLHILIPLCLGLLGLRGLLTEKTTFPSWHDYLWFAFSTYFMLNRQSLVANGERRDATSS
jgi:hypothetical protein